MADDARPLETSARLKAQIDSGRTGDKAGGFDPAAAPLGTDAEAAGARPTAGEAAQAERQEASAKPFGARNAVQPELAPDARMNASGSVLMGSAIGLVAAIAFALFLWLAVH